MAFRNFATFNAAGLAKQSKRLLLDNFCRDKNISLCAIQESNLPKNSYELNAGSIVGAPPISLHAGLAFWISKNFPVADLHLRTIVADSIMELTFFVADKFFICYNLHLPHRDNEVIDALRAWSVRLKFWNIIVPCFGEGFGLKNYGTIDLSDDAVASNSIFPLRQPDVIAPKQQQNFIVMGDFNMDLERAKSSATYLKKKSAMSMLHTILASLGLDFLSLSMISIPPPNTRGNYILDYICIPKIWKLYVHSMNVYNDVISDHLAVSVTIIQDELYTSPPYWRMKNELLSHQPYVNSMTSFLLHRTTDQPLDTQSFIIWWDSLKEDIISVSKKCWRTFKNNFSSGIGLSVRHENMSSASLFYRNQPPKIRFLKDENGNICSNQMEILDIASNFYADLFCADPLTKNPPQNMSFGLREIDPVIVQQIDSPLTVDDLFMAASKMNLSKAPGADGLTLEFYLKFWQILGPLILCWFNHMLSLGHLSGSAALGVIALIDKPGDSRVLSNWRPISLLAVELKIVAKALANKLLPAIKSVVSQHQTALPGSSIFDSLSVTRDIIFISEKFKQPLWILSLDQRKAYDCVSHTFLFHIMQVIGLPNYLIKSIKTLYSGFKCVVKNANMLSKPFPYSRGIWQGDPTSTLLFALVIQPLINTFCITLRDEGFILPSEDRILLTAYADDLTLFLRSHDSINTVVGAFNMVAEFSGAVLNVSKSQIMGFNIESSLMENITSLLPVKPSFETIKILGISFTTKLRIHPTQWQTKMSSSINTIARFSQSLIDMSYIQRANWIKRRLWPRWTFLFKVLQPSKQQLSLLSNMFTNVIWMGGRHWIPMTDLAVSIPNGGVGMIDPSQRINILRISFIARLLARDRASFQFQLAEIILDCYADLRLGFRLFHSFAEQDFLMDLPSVYAVALVAWNMLTICYFPSSIDDILDMPAVSSKFLLQLDEPIQISCSLARSIKVATIRDVSNHIPSVTRRSQKLYLDINNAIQEWMLPPWPDELVPYKDLIQDAHNKLIPVFFLINDNDSVIPCHFWSNSLIARQFRKLESQRSPNVPHHTWKILAAALVPPLFFNQFWRFLHGSTITPSFFFHMGLIDSLSCVLCSSSDCGIDHQFRKCPILQVAICNINNLIQNIGVPPLADQSQLYPDPSDDHKLANFIVVAFIYTVGLVTRSVVNAKSVSRINQSKFSLIFSSVIAKHLLCYADKFPPEDLSFRHKWSTYVHKSIIAFFKDDQLFILHNHEFKHFKSFYTGCASF